MSPKQGARLVVRHSSFGHPKCALGAFIEGHPLNHALEVIKPNRRQLRGLSGQPDSAETSIEPGQTSSICGSEAVGLGPSTGGTLHEGSLHDSLEQDLRSIGSREYTLIRCNLACLVEHDFVERHIRAEAASFCALSVKAKNEEDDSAAILPDGNLHLAVSKEAYQRLGLQGAHVPHDPDRYHIEVDLFGRSYEPGAPFYGKVMARLRSHTGPLNFLCIKTIDGATADIGFPAGTEILHNSRMRPVFTETDIRSPAPLALSALAHRENAQEAPQQVADPVVVDHMMYRFSHNRPVWEGFRESHITAWAVVYSRVRSNIGIVICPGQGADLTGAPTDDHLAVYEWLGGLSCGITGSEAPAKGAAEVPELEHLTRLTYTGLLPACSVMDAVQAARREVNGGCCAWAAVHVWGFRDAPVSWHGARHAHGPLLGGENGYTVLLLPKDQYVLYVAAGEGDHFSSIGLPVKAA